MRFPRIPILIALVTAGALEDRGTYASVLLRDLNASAPSVLETDARAMEALEDEGLSLARVLGASGPDNESLSRTQAWGSLLDVLGADIQELDARPGISESNPRKRFHMSWLRDRRARFELVGAVNRLDRAFLDPAACGEARLVYRLVLHPKDRAPTFMPMTLNVSFPQPKLGSCAAAAQAWQSLPAGGPARVHALAKLYAGLPRYTKLEINLQSFHDPTKGAIFADGSGYDDHAEYLLRSFDRVGEVLRPRLLVGTPRADLSEEERGALARWIHENFEAIDAGQAVIPDRFLASRALSVTPRGFERGPNRVFKALFASGAAFADLPYEKGRLVKSPAGLLRRLDQGTCQGCHETRAVAGFHLLGSGRTPEATLDTVAVARSAHLDIELPWRTAMTAAVARGAPYDTPRPFADRRQAGPGRAGAKCAVSEDPTFSGWTCVPELRCHPSGTDDVGSCAQVTKYGVEVGDPCEDVKLGDESPGTGPYVVPKPGVPCVFGPAPGLCEPNLLGFPGGMCVGECNLPGGVARGGEVVCANLPAAGYENECFTGDEPIETCIARYFYPRVLKTCSEGRACRDDYACARMAGFPPGLGACVPTYFVYGLRVDGPLLDR